MASSIILNDALNVTVRMPKTTDVHAKVTGDRGADLLRVECFPLDVARFDHLFRKRFENRFLPKFETKSFHVTNQATLLVPYSSQSFS